MQRCEFFNRVYLHAKNKLVFHETFQCAMDQKFLCVDSTCWLLVVTFNLKNSLNLILFDVFDLNWNLLEIFPAAAVDLGN